MFARAIAYFYFALSLAFLAAAIPGGKPSPTQTITVTQTASGPEPTSSCSTGAIQCCQSITQVRLPQQSVLHFSSTDVYPIGHGPHRDEDPWSARHRR